MTYRAALWERRHNEGRILIVMARFRFFPRFKVDVHLSFTSRVFLNRPTSLFIYRRFIRTDVTKLGQRSKFNGSIFAPEIF